jgi:hypothetical protein
VGSGGTTSGTPLLGAVEVGAPAPPEPCLVASAGRPLSLLEVLPADVAELQAATARRTSAAIAAGKRLDLISSTSV